MDEDWRKRVKDHFWSTRFNGILSKKIPGANLTKEEIKKEVNHLRKILVLRDILLSFGGDEACMPGTEDDLGLLLEYGEIWLPTGMILKKGARGKCHSNALYLWDANRGKVFVATGYYLSDDGMWRQHSWGICANSRGGRVVETTNPAVLYYGVVFSNEECESRLAELW